MDSLYSELREVDNLVADNSTHVHKAFQNAMVKSHHFGGCISYGHDESRGCEALDNLFGEIAKNLHNSFLVLMPLQVAIFI